MRRRLRTLITGGAGFIGTNLAARLLAEGERVLILDDLSRPGAERNLGWLATEAGGAFDVVEADVRDESAVASAARQVSAVFHLAAQVAVTTSLQDPRTDFEVNARGTLNVLEAVRARPAPPRLLFTSTNKVYGALEDLELREHERRYAPPDGSRHALGVSEVRPVEFHSPYGCSKGAADQYVLEWARTFGVPAVVFRMSCIYGPHQQGTEDQGWLAHLIRSALRGERITVYGDGKQVRDALYVDDLVEAFLLARARAEVLAGEAFNVGGGPANVLSLLDLVELIQRLEGTRPLLGFADWRLADQRWYVSDCRKLRAATGWAPRVPLEEGVRRLHAWLRQASIPSSSGRSLPEVRP